MTGWPRVFVGGWRSFSRSCYEKKENKCVHVHGNFGMSGVQRCNLRDFSYWWAFPGVHSRIVCAMKLLCNVALVNGLNKWLIKFKSIHLYVCRLTSAWRLFPFFAPPPQRHFIELLRVSTKQFLCSNSKLFLRFIARRSTTCFGELFLILCCFGGVINTWFFPARHGWWHKREMGTFN